MDVDRHDPQVVNDSIDTRGGSDWSVQDLITFDMDDTFQHDVYLMNKDGSNLTQFLNGNNSQGASFSPDGTGLRRLTENTYSDYQLRWGK